MCVAKSKEKGRWQQETLDPSALSDLRAAAHFIWKSMQQNAVNCQTSDFGSYCFAQNSEIPWVFGSDSGMGAKKGGINGAQNEALELRNAVHDYCYVPLKHKVCKLSCQTAASQRDSQPRFTRGKTSSCL